MYQRLMLFYFSLATSVAANQFLTTCWNPGLTTDGRTLIAECTYKHENKTEQVFKSAVDLNRCLRFNDDGDLAPAANGIFRDKVQLCQLDHSATLNCSRKDKGRVTFELNNVVFNDDGILGCTNYTGVPIESIMKHSD
ncbi:hypothetical protein BDV41DRAFT_571044 [Aspergillus transmontanensis]|uniref:Cyanovirin-N domain-containing protein n=1 Tax=Aspergillus transmontanensis TaxID=1034304 RepID=A0A5N6WEW6_9EURO|nr:hypothetical protein BDV41DRAFT_571044 [Aspergillus transmontanensis]